jgi:hypothetical protein
MRLPEIITDVTTILFSLLILVMTKLIKPEVI